ncbi:YhdP family phospholipid transporter [Marinobacter confluentis]|uniref:YhdP central domain-containing protein n=1 Tax=Marinobacter confluentis TaxID=1697557 RepID=A0A4Z1C9F6_9GAMM|nr:AsmA-like C-terminal region-containing protein [Marinobacter confluentis]TGN40016.1 hypothetical protein E5Q11_06900 [Marinobacter confluentis]
MNAAAAEEKPKGFAIRTLAKLATLFWWLLLAVLVLAALYAGLGRQITQNIDDYRPQIEQQLSDLVGQEIVIGSLSSRWNWLNPTIIARDLSMKPTAGEADVGSLQSLRVGLDFLASLRRFRIVFSDFEANGLELVINQSAQGEIEVEGADLPEPVADDLSEWIDLAGQWLSDPSVKVTRVILGLRDGAGKLRQVEIPQLDLVYRQGLFHASGRAMRPGTTQQLASFRLVGQHFFRGDFTGQFYGDINSGRLFDGLIQEYGWRGIRAEGFDVGGQLWLTFRDGLMEQVSGILKTPYLQLGVGSESLAPLEDISARFGWRRSETDRQISDQGEESETPPWHRTGQFHLNDLSWRWNGETVPGFDLRFQTGSALNVLVADRLPIAPVRGLLSRLQILPDAVSGALGRYRPAGNLDQLLLQVPTDESGQFRLTAELRDIQVRAVDGAPAAQGLYGSLVVTPSGGLVSADSDDLTFGFPSLFRGLWQVRNFSADVAWRFDDGATRVYSQDIAMDYGPEARLSGAFDLKLVPGGEDVLGLQVGVQNGKADMLADFVPAKIVDQGLYDWLTTAIREVDIRQGSYFGHGQIGSGSPPGSFVSSMVYDFENGTVAYDERWPEVTGASGRVFVHQGQTRIDLATGRTGGIDLQPGQVRVEPGIGDDSTMVYIDAAAPVTGDALAWWMEGSPLGELAGAASDSLVVEGDFFLDLGLALALDSEQAPEVNARVRTEAGSVRFPGADLEWTNVSGEVSYSTENGFSSAPVSARFLGNPVSVWFRKSQFGNGLTLRQQGQVDVAALQNRLDLPEGSSPGVSGRLAYEAVLELPPDSDPVIRLMSDLVGVTIDWPAPLGKPAATQAPLDITLEPGLSEGLGVNVDWQERMNLDLVLQAGRVDLAVNDLRLGERRFQDMRLDAVSGAENWLINISSDWLRGMITWPVAASGSGSLDRDRVVNVDLEKLALARNEEQLAEDEAPLQAEDPVKAFQDMDFASWPEVNVRIADLQINNENAGRWSFRLRPEASEVTVENIEGQLKSLMLAGVLRWRIENNQERTGFQGTLNGESLADIGALFSSEIPFRSDRTAINLDLDWPGRPDQFSVDRLSGSASMRFDDGVILEGNSTAQLFRVFNLLNSDTLWRRLKLDFSDLYEAGVAFDAISGKATLDNGLLTLDPELQIVGPSGAFKFSGTTSMAQETLDMNMVVVLPLTQNLPLAAVLLGAGAPIGGALFVLDKVLGDPLSKLTSATYSVEGSWDEPDVRLRRVFDNGD